MKVRVDIGRLVLHDRPVSRRERIALHDDIARELCRLLTTQAAVLAGDRRRHAPSVARQIAEAVAAALPSQSPGRPGAPR
jgi:hypothetical protein